MSRSERLGGVSRSDLYAALIVICCAALGLLTILWAAQAGVEPYEMPVQREAKPKGIEDHLNDLWVPIYGMAVLP